MAVDKHKPFFTFIGGEISVQNIKNAFVQWLDIVAAALAINYIIPKNPIESQLTVRIFFSFYYIDKIR